MRRWLVILFAVPVGLWFLFWNVAAAEGEEMRLSSSYAGLLDDALLAYIKEHPDTLARSGYQNTDAPPRPCDPLSTEGRGPSSYECAAMRSDANTVPAWLTPIVPLKVTVRITPRVWADPGARALLLNLVRSKAAACATPAAAPDRHFYADSYERFGLGCDERQPPNHQVWFNITAARGVACVHHADRSVHCDHLKVDDSRRPDPKIPAPACG